MPQIYGAAPVTLGLYDLHPREMMFWLYCPIRLPGSDYKIPANLEQFSSLVAAVERDLTFVRPHWFLRNDYYVYLTAKTLWVTPDNPGNRPGFHSDGFMTDDLNYIWSDIQPTLFWVPDERVSFTQDHHASLAEMEAAAEPDVAHHQFYGDKHLLRLDQTVIHRVPDITKPGMRSFVKISVSRHRYNLIGNSINHELAPNWEYAERSEERNHPIAEPADAGS